MRLTLAVIQSYNTDRWGGSRGIGSEKLGARMPPRWHKLSKSTPLENPSVGARSVLHSKLPL